MKLGVYQHYKGDLYEVVGVGRHSETLEKLVIYKALYGDYGLWVRPKELFEGFVEVDGEVVVRFCFLHENMAKAPEVE